MAPRVTVRGARREFQVRLEGPIFEPNVHKTFGANIQALMDVLAAEGQRTIKTELVARRRRIPYWTGHTFNQVRGRTRSLTGRRWRVSLVVSADTSGMSAREATRTKAAAAQLEARYHMFRRTAAALRRSRNILAANLTKGLD